MDAELTTAVSQRRKALRLCVAWAVVAGAALAATPAFAQQEFPNRPLRFLVPFAPGGVSDIASRIVATEMSSILGQAITVENRPGAGGVTAIEVLTKLPPDGYTMAWSGAAPIVTLQITGPKPAFGLKELALVGSLGTVELLMIANPGSPYRTVQQIVAAAKSNPGVLAYSNGGIGTPAHLGFEYLKLLAKVDMPSVSYKGDLPAVTDVLSGQVQVGAAAIATALPYIRSGKVRAVAVFSGQRSPLLPDVPTVAESGYPEFDAVAFGVLVVPAATPAAVVNRLNAALNEAFGKPGIRDRFLQIAMIGGGGTPRQTSDFIARETEKWTRVIKEQGIKLGD